jgi:hypothetical protein
MHQLDSVASCRNRASRQRRLLTALLLLLSPAAWAQLSGPYYVGTGTSPDPTRTYASLPAAVAALSPAGVSGPVTFTLLDASYSLGAALTIPAVAGASALNTISFVPASGVSPVISGSVVNTSGGLLILDGTDYLSLNGYDGSTSARTITVRNTGNGPAVLLRNDATYNSLRYLTLESANVVSATTAGATAGTVLLGTSTGTTGNDFNTIASCDVRAVGNSATTVPTYAIASAGTAAATNSDNAIRACNVYNFSAAGIYLNNAGNGGSWTVGGPTAADGNNVYQTGARTTDLRYIRLTGGDANTVSNNQVYSSGTLTGAFYGVAVVGGGGHTITNNTIGGSAANAGGSPFTVSAGTGFGYPFYLDLSTAAGAATSSVQGNVVRNISSASTGTLYGIDLRNGKIDLGTVAANLFGGTGSGQGITHTGIYYGVHIESAASATIQGNTFTGVSTTAPTLAGIYSSSSAASTVSGNTFSTLSSAGNNTTATASPLAGVYVSGTGAVTLSNNIINTLSSSTTATTAATIPVVGVWLGSAAGAPVTGNQISGLSATGGAPVFGVYVSGSAATTISGNTISTLSAGGTTAAALAGINSTGSGVVAIDNNTVNTLSQTGLTTNLYGIQNNGTTGSNVTNNTVTSVTYSGSTAGNTGYGIFANGSTTISGNTVTTLQATGSSKLNLRGIYVGSAGNPTVTGNTVTGVLNSTTGADVQTIGLYVGSTGTTMTGMTVRGNVISNVGTTNTTATASTNVVTGLQLGLTTSALVERNRIWNVYGNTPGTGTNADVVRGLAFAASPLANFTGTIANNQISLPAGVATQLTYGIFDNSTGGTSSYFYNTVYLSGSAATAPSYGFFRSTVTATTPATTPANLTLRNNIFYNERAGTAFAIGVAEAGTFSSNYNLFVTPGAGVVGSVAGTSYDFAGWQTATSGDAASYDRRPAALPSATVFTAPASGDLHINPAYYASASIIESGGTAVSIANDYDNDPRFGAAGYSGSGTAPDLGSDEYNATPPANMAYDPATGTAVTQLTGAVAAGSTNQAVIRVALTTTGTATPLTLTQLSFSADGTTANGTVPANISNARVYFTGSNGAFSTTTPFGTAVAPAFSTAGGFSIAGSQPLSEGVNYFFLTYDVMAGSPTGDVLDGVLTGVQIGSGAVSAIAPATGAPAGSRPILGPLAGAYTVGYELGTETYPSLTAAVADLSSRGVAPGQGVTFTLTNPGATKPYDATTAATAANQETFPIVIPAIGLGTGQTLSIVPATGITPLISGSVASANGGLLILDGTDYLSIDGNNGATSARTITIRNAGSGAAVLLRNDATYNSLRYLTLESGVTGNAGTVMFGTSAGTTGNDFNTVASCDVRDLSVAPNTVPTNGIYSLGTGAAPTAPALPAATANSNNTVQSCNIYNYTNGGVYLSATGSGDNWTVGGATAALGNSFYQTAARGSQVLNIRLGTGNSHVVSNNQVYGGGAITGNFYGISVVGEGSGHTVTNNTIGGSGAGATGAPLAVNGSGTFYGIYLSLGTATASTVQGNQVANVASTLTGSGYGIQLVAGAATISSNTIDGLSNTAGTLAGIQTSGSGVTVLSTNTVSNLSQTGTSSNLYGIQANLTTGSNVTGNSVSNLSYSGTSGGISLYGIYAGGSNTVSNNTITTVQSTASANNNLRGIYMGGAAGATPIVTGNTVSGVLNGTTGSTNTHGIFVGSATAGAVLGITTIQNNRISNVGTTNTTSTTSTHVVSGLLCGAAASGSLTERNRIWNVYGSTAGTGSTADVVRGLAVQGTYSGTFTNNQISLAPGAVNQLSYGLLDASTGGSTDFFYNSVYVAPASAASTGSSFGFFRSAATTPPASSLRNNIFYNGRLADTGAAAFAIGTATSAGFTATTSNYNLFIGSNAATIGNFGGTATSFADWKTQTGGDASSLSETATTVAATNLFADLATGNLDVNPASSEAWYANGNGVQLSNQTADFDSPTAGRSTTVAAGGTDLGSDEFTPTSMPPALTVSAAPALGGTQVFSLGGRTLATVAYGSTGTVPTSTTGRYYSGTNPTVAVTTTRYTNYFTEITATGGTGFTYSLVLNYDDALLGLVQTEANQHLLKRNANGTFEFFPTSVTDATANTITATGLTSFSQFFGNDEATPLPVTLSSFSAFRRGHDAELDWTTATEKNNTGYEIQVATDGSSYRKLGFVRSETVNSNMPQSYQYIDTEDGKQGIRYYRLRQLDLNGKASYSTVQTVSFGEAMSPLALMAAPNPFTSELTLTMTLPKPGGTVPLTITDAAGRCVYSQLVTLPAGTSHLELKQLDTLPNGLYLIHVKLNEQTQHLKVVKQ